VLYGNFLATYSPDPLPLSFIKGRGSIGERGFAPLYSTFVSPTTFPIEIEIHPLAAASEFNT